MMRSTECTVTSRPVASVSVTGSTGWASGVAGAERSLWLAVADEDEPGAPD